MKKTETPTDIIKTDSNGVTSAINAELLAEVNNSIIVIREQPVIIDADVAALYGVETKRINEAVRNNPNKSLKSICLNLLQRKLHICGRKFRPQNFQANLPLFLQADG